MLECGRLIADCKIVKPLVENQTYQTCLVEAPKFGLVWMHLFNAGVFPDEKARQKFVTAANSLLGMTFSGVCSPLHAEASKECCYVLYPLPVGQSLADCKDSAYTLRQALEIVLQAARCLDSAHRAGLWHGNLSLASIFIDNESLVLADFALSSLVRLDFNSGVEAGYCSPELVRGEPLGPASDLYSLGIILFRLLTGKEPFTGEQPFAIAMQHLQGEIPRLPEPSAICQPLLDSLLQAMADDRMSAAELIENLLQLLALPNLDEFDLPLELSLSEVLTEPLPAGLEDLKADNDSSVASAAARTDRISPVQQLIVESDVTARIEKRLQERAAALQSSAQNQGHDRADSTRIAAINRQDGQTVKMMSQKRYQDKSGRSRLLLLTLLGIAIGAVLYLLIFQQRADDQQLAGSKLPTALETALEEGRLQLQSDDLAAAEKTFVALIDQFPGDPQPYNNLAVVYALQGQLDAARSALEQALATDAGYATVYRNLGTIYAEMARDSYGRALQLKKGQQSVSLLMFAESGPLPLQLAKSISEAPTAPMVEPVVAVSVPTPRPLVETDIQAGSTVIEAAAVITPEPVQEQITEVVLAQEPESAERFLQRWAAAWTAQDIDSYL